VADAPWALYLSACTQSKVETDSGKIGDISRMPGEVFACRANQQAAVVVAPDSRRFDLEAGCCSEIPSRHLSIEVCASSKRLLP
jgi:hypothetical protein